MKNVFKILLVFIVVSISFVSLGACSKKDKISSNNKERLKNIKMPLENQDALELDVYFDGCKSDEKVEIVKEELILPKEEVLGQYIMNTLIKGPSIESNLKPIFPMDTRLLSFSIKDNIAVVNLTKEAVLERSKTKEEACIRSVVNTLTQLPAVDMVKILVDNSEVETLGGNYSIISPIGKDDTLVKLNKQ